MLHDSLCSLDLQGMEKITLNEKVCSDFDWCSRLLCLLLSQNLSFHLSVLSNSVSSASQSLDPSSASKCRHDQIWCTSVFQAFGLMRHWHCKRSPKDISSVREVIFTSFVFCLQNTPLITYGRPKGDGVVRIVSSVDKKKQDRLSYLQIHLRLGRKLRITNCFQTVGQNMECAFI